MPIVGGLDIHRKQLTFDYLDTVTGEVQRGQVAPADREHLRAWLAPVRRPRRRRVRAGGVHRVAVRRRGAGCGRGRGARGRAGRHRRRPRPQAARQDRQDRRPAPAAAAGRGPAARNAGSRPAASWSAGRCWRLYHDLRGRAHRLGAAHPRGLLPPGRPAPGRGRAAHRAGRWPRCGRPRRRACGRAGQDPGRGRRECAVLEDRLHELRHRLLDAAGEVVGAKVLAERIYGVGPVTALALTCWLGGKGRFSSARKAVRFAGLDITVYSSDGKRSPGRLSRQGTGRAPLVPVYEAGKAHARTGRTRPRLLRSGERPDRRQARAAISEARKIIRQACHILSELGDDALTTT